MSKLIPSRQTLSRWGLLTPSGKLVPSRWGALTLASVTFVVLYAIIAVLGWRYDAKFNDWARDTLNALLSVSITIISLRVGGILTDFYDRLTDFGITDVTTDRKGSDSLQTSKWLKRIEGSNEVTIVGTLSWGWFVVAKDHLLHLLRTNKYPESLVICLQDPFGRFSRSKIETTADHEKFVRAAATVFHSLRDLLSDKELAGRITLQLYDAEPLSCVIARGSVYWALYLPHSGRENIPELTLTTRSFLGDKLSTESIQKLRASAPIVSAESLTAYIDTMERLLRETRDTFWSHPDVTCDFCKERRHIPSEISRRHPQLLAGGRIAAIKSHFYVAPSLGPLAEDHALIITNDHLTSSAQLLAPAMDELKGLFAQFDQNVRNKSRHALFFEHGVPSDGNSYGGCGICHCHIHALHFSEDHDCIDALKAYLADKTVRFREETLSDWGGVTRFVGESYLCVKAGQRPPTVFVFDRGQRIESQLMRQFVAKVHLNQPQQWDWRTGTTDQQQLTTSSAKLKQIFS